MGTVGPSSIDIKMGLYTLMFISRPLNIKENDGLNTYMYMCKLPPLQSLVYNTLGEVYNFLLSAKHSKRKSVVIELNFN